MIFRLFLYIWPTHIDASRHGPDKLTVFASGASYAAMACVIFFPASVRAAIQSTIRSGGKTMHVYLRWPVFAALLLLFALTACQRPPAPHPNVEAIGDGVFLYRSGSQRSLFMVTDEGVIVTDPINAAVAKSYREAIATLTDEPVKYVVYSHYHWDRIAGADIFKKEGAEIIAQEQCAERFKVNPNDAVLMPDIIFSDRYAVSLGGKSLDLYYFGPSHGDCLTVFLARPANVVQIVELVNPPGATFPADRNVPYVKPHNLDKFFAAAEALVAEQGVQQIVASSVTTEVDEQGAEQISPPVGPASIIHDQAMFWEAIYSEVAKARAEGNVGIDSFVRLKGIDLTRFEPYANYNPEDLPIIMRRFVGYYDMGR
jgi:hypothetical protein